MGFFSGIKKVFKSVVNVVKKIAVPVLIAAAIYFTAGALAPTLLGQTFTSGLASFGSGVSSALGLTAGGTISNIVTAAATSAVKGALVGGLTAAVTGNNIGKGALLGGLTGGVIGGVGEAIQGVPDAASTAVAKGQQGLSGAPASSAQIASDNFAQQATSASRAPATTGFGSSSLSPTDVIQSSATPVQPVSWSDQAWNNTKDFFGGGDNVTTTRDSVGNVTGTATSTGAPAWKTLAAEGVKGLAAGYIAGAGKEENPQLQMQREQNERIASNYGTGNIYGSSPQPAQQGLSGPPNVGQQQDGIPQQNQKNRLVYDSTTKSYVWV